MKTHTTNELRGMVAEGCQGHEEANAALAELYRRADAAPDLHSALALAVFRIEVNNAVGSPILSDWLPYARAAIAKAEEA